MSRESTRLLIADRPLQVLPKLAMVLGLNEAMVVQQVYYWQSHQEDADDGRHFYEGRHWVYNTYAEWRLQFPFWSDRTLREVFRLLEQPFEPKVNDPRPPRAPLLFTGNYNREFKGDPWDRTKWYSVNVVEIQRLEEFAISMWQNLPNGYGKVCQMQPAGFATSLDESETTDKRLASKKKAAHGAAGVGSVRASSTPAKAGEKGSWRRGGSGSSADRPVTGPFPGFSFVPTVPPAWGITIAFGTSPAGAEARTAARGPMITWCAGAKTTTWISTAG